MIAMQPEEDEDRPDWEEVEPEEEKESRGGVLGGTAPLARIVFALILLGLVIGTALALKAGWTRWFGG
jgi:hypothetical protein